MLQVDVNKFETKYKEKLKEIFKDDAKWMSSNMNKTYMFVETYRKKGWAICVTSYPTSTTIRASHADDTPIELNCTSSGKEKLVLCLLFLMLEGVKFGDLIDEEVKE
jgi:hypothetical protein